MADNPHNASNAVFGLNDNPSRESGTPPDPGTSGSIGRKFPTGPILIVLILALLIVSAVNLDMAVQSKKIASQHAEELSLLTHRMNSSDDNYAQLKAQFEVTAEKLGMTQTQLSRERVLAANIERQQRVAVYRLNRDLQTKASAQDVNKDVNQLQSEASDLTQNLAGTQKDLDATKQSMTDEQSNLTGAIAHTHAELVALAHRTDRDYFEFSLPRKHSRAKIGDVLVQLDKTNWKKNMYTVNLLFDDHLTMRKDEALDSPVYFYVAGAAEPLELVVNRVKKNAISGYLSTPKGLYPNVPNVLNSRPTA